MSKLRFQGEFTVEKLFTQYKWEIYDNIIKSIKDNHDNPLINELEIVEITTGSTRYPIILSRERFIDSLNRCIEFFEELEEYERCQACVDIIKDINKHNLNTTNGIRKR